MAPTVRVMSRRRSVHLLAAIALGLSAAACSGSDDDADANGQGVAPTVTETPTPPTTVDTSAATTDASADTPTTAPTTTAAPTTAAPTPAPTTSDANGATATAPPPAPAEQEVVPGEMNGRPYELVVPSGYDGSTPVPLVMLVHGYTSSGPIQEAYFGLAPLAQERGFLYAYPDGTVDMMGNRFWNATDACCNFGGSEVDDVGHLLAIIEEISDAYAVDPDRIHLVGHSNGGFMSYRMACEHADVIASVVSLAGATFADPDACQPSEPVGVVQVHGTADPVIGYEGGTTAIAPVGGGVYPGALDTAAAWATSNGCEGPTPGGDLDGVTEVTEAVLDLDDSIAGDDTMVTTFLGCPDGGHVEVWTIVGGGHVPPLSDGFRTAVVDAALNWPSPPRGD